MKRIILFIIFFSCISFNLYAEETPSFNQQQTIVLFRHGEKPFWDMGQLVCTGLNRALALPRVLQSKFGQPQFLFAPHPFWDNYYYYVRAFVTIEPTAIQFGLPLNTAFYFHEVDEIVNEILSQKYHHSLIFIAWEHVKLVAIARNILSRLGGQASYVPNWPSNDFDSLYVINIDWSKKPATAFFNHDYEHLNNQSDQCTAGLTYNKKRDQIETVVIVPDAESALHAPNQLSCLGLNRALALSKFLNDLYPKIDLFLLPKPLKTNAQNFHKALMTIEPTIIELGGLFIPVSRDFKDVVRVMDKHASFNEVAIITWPFADVTALAKKIFSEYGGNADEIPEVPNRDIIYELSIKEDKSAKPSFKMFQYTFFKSNICPQPL